LADGGSKPLERGEAKSLPLRRGDSLREVALATVSSSKREPGCCNASRLGDSRGIDHSGLRLSSRGGRGSVCPEPGQGATVGQIVKEGIKDHFKKHASEKLGPLWQDYADFCEMPMEQSEHGFCFCRKFVFHAKQLDGGIWPYDLQ